MVDGNGNLLFTISWGRVLRVERNPAVCDHCEDSRPYRRECLAEALKTLRRSGAHRVWDIWLCPSCARKEGLRW